MHGRILDFTMLLTITRHDIILSSWNPTHLINATQSQSDVSLDTSNSSRYIWITYILYNLLTLTINMQISIKRQRQRNIKYTQIAHTWLIYYCLMICTWTLKVYVCIYTRSLPGIACYVSKEKVLYKPSTDWALGVNWLRFIYNILLMSAYAS